MQTQLSLDPLMVAHLKRRYAISDVGLQAAIRFSVAVLDNRIGYMKPRPAVFEGALLLRLHSSFSEKADEKRYLRYVCEEMIAPYV